jgi:pimeloyl-ACP methyl ester carboxylesterase
MCNAFWESFATDSTRDVYEPVRRGRRVVRFDPRGVGLSKCDVAEFTHDRMVRDLETVIDAAAHARFSPYATTFSVAWAIDYAARHPDRVERLILTRGYTTGLAVMARDNFDGIIVLIKTNWKMAVQLLSDQGTREADPERGTRLANEVMNAIDPVNAARWFAGLYETTDVKRCLADVEAPTLVLHRRGDTLFPFSGAEEIASGIPQARLTALAGDGSLAIGDTEANMQLLVDFLDDVSPVSA